MIEDIADWPSGTVRIAWHAAEQPELPVTGAHGFCFHQGEVLVCDIGGRGMTIPGGHLDGAESAVDCLAREAFEEACVDLANLRLVGFIEADHRENSTFDGQYPVRSVQAIYRADVVSVHGFSIMHESTDRRFIAIADLPSVHHEWNAVLDAAFNAALEVDVR